MGEEGKRRELGENGSTREVGGLGLSWKVCGRRNEQAIGWGGLKGSVGEEAHLARNSGNGCSCASVHSSRRVCNSPSSEN